VGLASAGIGMGVLQIPEEQRNNVCNHATTSLVKARDMALELSDTVSTSCGKCINNENPADAAEEVRKKFIDQCCSGIDEKMATTLMFWEGMNSDLLDPVPWLQPLTAVCTMSKASLVKSLVMKFPLPQTILQWYPLKRMGCEESHVDARGVLYPSVRYIV
jgi:hypothetical protein